MITYLKIMKPFGLRVLIDLRYLKALLLLPAMISWHQAKSQSPTLSLIGSQQLIHQIGKEYIDRGATAIDNEGFAVEVIVSGAVNGMMAGIYEIEYTATDDSGNISSVTRTITVADTIAPTLSLNG